MRVAFQYALQLLLRIPTWYSATSHFWYNMVLLLFWLLYANSISRCCVHCACVVMLILCALVISDYFWRSPLL